MNPEDEETWRRALLRTRVEKDEYFLTGRDSPLPGEADAPRHPLSYFPPAEEYRIEVKLQRYPDPETVAMTTSKGTRKLFKKVGRFEFKVGDQPTTLQAYQSAERDDPTMFVPFRDATSGKESYGASRYIDLEVEHDDSYVLDFNYAYNPYCAYSDAYVCPLPPPENWLRVPINAGEKKYRG